MRFDCQSSLAMEREVRQRVLKPTPHPTPTPINVSQLSTLYNLEPFPMMKEFPDPWSDGFRFFHYLHARQAMGSTPSQVGSRWLINAYSRHSILWMQGDGFASEHGGIMEVAMWLWLCLAWVQYLTMLLVLSNEGGILITCKVIIYGAYALVKEASGLTLNIHQIFS